MFCESAHKFKLRIFDHSARESYRACTHLNGPLMPTNHQNIEFEQEEVTEPAQQEHSDPIGAMLERTRGDDLDFDGAFEEQRLMQLLFGLPLRDSSIDRFLVQERIGSGGMGEVYRAWDPKLRRHVALKLLRTNVGQGLSAHVLDEARALARVEHDNVVRVYDADVHDDRPYLTMELIEGQTLARWLKRDHGVTAIIAVFVRAGNGLRAIHETGLVHGDFKPRNVLIASDGRVRVADFGLAATIAPDADGGQPFVSRAQPAGTLAYLAPEQFEGSPATPASDQFSFCVALFEAIYGVLPFPRRDADELRDSITRCELHFPDRPKYRVPAWLERLLARGLSRDPNTRYPDMAALIDDLGRDRRSRRRAIVAACAVTLTASLVTWLGFWAPPSSAVADPLADVWDAAQRERLQTALSTIDASWTEGLAATVIGDLDRWATRWRPRWVYASDRQRDCLATQRHDVLTIVEQLELAEPAVLRSAPELTAALADPSRCFDASLSAASLTPDQLELREQLATAAVDRIAGNLDAADTRIAHVLERARAERDRVLEIDALRERAPLLVARGRRAAAIEQLRTALTLATELEDWRRVALIYVELPWTADDMTAAALRHEWLARARAHVQALGVDRDTRLAAVRLELSAALDMTGEQPGAAEQHLNQLVAELASLDAEHSLLAVQIHHALAGAITAQGSTRQADADTAFARALELGSVVWGTGHPELAKLWSDWGIHALRYGQSGFARERMLESLRLREAAYSVPHPLLARSRIQLAQLELAEGQLDSAKRHASAATDNLTAELDQDRAAEIWRVVAQIAMAEGELERAIAHYRRSLAAAGPDESMDRSLAEVELATALAAAGQCTEANLLFDKSIEKVEKEIVPFDPAILLETWEQRIRSLEVCGDQQRAQRERQRIAAHLQDPEHLRRLARGTP